MKRILLFTFLSIVCSNIYASVFTTKALLDACGYVVLAKNSPEIRFTNTENFKYTQCVFYIAGVADTLSGVRISVHLESKHKSKCFDKWLKAPAPLYPELAVNVYRIISNTPKTLKMPPDMAVAFAYNSMYPLQNCKK